MREAWYRLRGRKLARRTGECRKFSVFIRSACGLLQNYPRTYTALKLSTTCPPEIGRPKVSIGRKREKISI